jgi:predicted esterase
MSTYVRRTTTTLTYTIIKQSIMSISRDLPVLWCHGIADKKIPISYGEDAIAFLRDSVDVPQTKVQHLFYEGLEHTTWDDELSDVASWLNGIFLG